MTLTEQDGALALRGYVLSRTGVLPTDPDFVALCRDETMLRFCAHWLRKREDDWFEMLSKLLGVVWNRRDVERMLRRASVAARPDDVFIPLALGCNPQLSEQLKELFVPKSGPIAGGEYMPEPGEEIVELGDVTPEQFKQWAAMATGMSNHIAKQREEPLSIKREGERLDPRIEQIRQQIAASKRFG